MNNAKNGKVGLSIVIAAWNGNESLRQCLASLEKQTDRAGVEVIIASNFAVSEAISDAVVKLIQVDGKTTVPEIRSAGLVLATGAVVAFVEDHCIFDANWCEQIKMAHESVDAAIGGSVENASAEKALDWAVYFYDYGKYMLPAGSGVVDALSGLNLSYKRAALDEIFATYQNGFFETTVNDELKRRGHALRLWPGAIVYHNKTYEFKRAAGHCYHLARSYAAQRISGVSIPKRLVFAAFSLVLPFLLPARIVLTTLKKGRNIIALMRSLPFIILLMFIWSYGEFCGYFLGEGKSALEWR